MTSHRFSGRLPRAVVAAGVAFLAACSDAPTSISPTESALFGNVPASGGIIAAGDGVLFPEQLEVCKVWANGVTPSAIQVRLQVTGSVTKDTTITIAVDAGRDAAGSPIQCALVWQNSRITADVVTVTEVVPTSGYTTDWKLETILFPLRSPFILGPTTTGTGTSVASITIGGPGNNPGALVTFTNTPLPTGSIGDFVWNDLNADGVQDGGEPGFANVPLDLIQNGNVIGSTTTNGSGIYTFAGLPAGDYTVCVSTPPAGFAQTYDLDGVATAHCAAASLTTGQDRTDVDFGYVQLGSIGDRVWNDVNGDGVQDVGEAGLNGWTVTLRNSANVVVGTASTSGNGTYTFGSLFGGTYSVCVTPASGYTQTYDLDGLATPHCATATLATAQHRTDVDFGYLFPPTIGGQGCTPGYWKQSQHFDSWKVYATSDMIDAVFGVTFRSVGKNNPKGPLTLLQALGLNGNNDGEQLFRHGTAALLNSVSTSGVNSNYTSAQVIQMVRTAWLSGNATTIANTKSLLAAANEQGCPLN